MADFASQPPSQKSAPVGKFFRGGLMPAAPLEHTGLIVFDLRSLKISSDEGKKIEQVLRTTLFAELEKRGHAKNRSAVDLSSAVLGIAIE